MNFIKGIPPKLLRDKFGLYTGGNRAGWHGDMDRCWIDNDNNICVCSRLIRTQFGNVEHVTISRGTGTCDGTGGFTWAEKQEIKDTLFGENRFAIEIYPKRKNLVDVCDVYHLWVFDKKVEMPFGIAKGEYQASVNRGYSVNSADLEKMRADYIRTGKMRGERMQITGECSRKNTCYDCQNENCIFAGKKASDCPKYQCDNDHDCDHCEFVDKFIEEERRRYGSNR